MSTQNMIQHSSGKGLYFLVLLFSVTIVFQGKLCSSFVTVSDTNQRVTSGRSESSFGKSQAGGIVVSQDFFPSRSSSSSCSTQLYYQTGVQDDFTSIPFDLLFGSGYSYESAINRNIFYSTDLVPQMELSVFQYADMIEYRHEACKRLFPGYKTGIIRKNRVGNDVVIRWRAEWIPSSSEWLYTLADKLSWEIITLDPNPYQVSTFSWTAVKDMLSNAFQTGVIYLPIAYVEGTTYVRYERDNFGSQYAKSIKETIDLVQDAGLNNIQNRKVAEELSSWLDVSRRPPRINEEQWASSVRYRILSSVPNSGALDIDPNEKEFDDMVGGFFSNPFTNLKNIFKKE